MLVDLGFLDNLKAQSLQLISKEPSFEGVTGEKTFVAAVETSPGEYYLHGCRTQEQIKEAIRCYQDIIWYETIPARH